jgi:superfamily I DNA/RNA helicase
MSEQASDQQKQAINQLGGLLLKAGAGSGKTFVIIHNLINYLETRVLGYIDDGEKYAIQQKLSRIAVITFTVKASEELRFRITKKLTELDAGDPRWSTILDNFHFIYIGTIHGLCLKFLNKKSVEFGAKELIDTTQAKWEIEKYLHRYLLDKSQLLSYFKFESLVQYFFQVFQSAEKRIGWKLGLEQTYSHDEFILQVFQIYGVSSEAIENLLSDFHGTEDSTKNWYLYLKCLGKEISIDKRDRQIDFIFNEYKGVRKPKNVNESFLSLWEKIKTIKGYLQKNGPETILSKDEANKVKTALRHAIDFLEESQLKAPFYSFCDLEYYSYLQTRNSKHDEFDYMVVDEFQDTSKVQFKIILGLIFNSPDRLFCVGDIKQAIYGFRGGDVSTFLEAENKIPKTKKLMENYRSSVSVVNFVNSLFGQVFPPEFEVDQISCKKEIAGGIVHGLVQYSNEKDEKPKKKDLIALESRAVLNLLNENKIENDKTCAVLFRDMGQSGELVKLLRESGYSFKVQNKEDYFSDIVFNLTIEYLKYLKDPNQTNKDLLLSAINFYSNQNNELHDLDQVLFLCLQAFYIHGLLPSFQTFIFKLSFPAPLISKGISIVERVLVNCHSNIQYGISELSRLREEKYIEWEYISGERNTNITLSTVHASKGLEYHHVFLFGTSLDQKHSVSDIKSSNIDAISINRKINDRFLTHSYLIEKLKDTLSSENENKRVFYVACTRAIESLYYFSFDINEKSVVGKRSNFGKFIQGNKNLADKVSTRIIQLEEKTGERKNQTGDFSYQGLGQVNKKDFTFFPNLSATGLALLAECPYKFYLSQVMKFDQDEILAYEALCDVQSSSMHSDQVSDNESRSSIKRGLKFHKLFEDYIKDGLVPVKISESDQLIFEWVKSMVDEKKKNSIFESEKEFKFPIKGHMISATPDLIIRPKNGNEVMEIWDFKTGAQSSSKEVRYFAQLHIYAKAAIDYYHLNRSAIELKIIYVDQKQFQSVKVQSGQVGRVVDQYWEKLSNLQEKNISACGECEYFSVCHG